MALISRTLAFLLALVATLALAQAAAPTLSNPTGVGESNGEATLTVTVSTNGADTTVVFEYGLTNTYGSSEPAPVVTDNANPQTATVTLTGLTPGQTYHFRATAFNVDGNATPTADQTFIVPPFVITGTASPIGTNATLNGTVTSDLLPGIAYFEYGLTNAYGSDTSANPDAIPANAMNVAFDAEITGLTRNTTYHFRAVFMETGGVTVFGEDKTFVTNNPPVANTDTISVAGGSATTINPLVNDRDPDGDAISLVDVATDPQFGTAVVNGNSIIYTPDGTFTGFDTFTYTIEDQYGLTATGTINIRSVRAAFSGTHGGLIKNSVGKEIGYFTVMATSLGTFTGLAIIDGNRYVVAGTISPEGIYRGFATGSDGVISVFIFPDNGETSTKLTALFDSGRWYSELTLSPEDRTTRPLLTGRYNASIAAGGSGSAGANGNDPGTPPDAAGWLAIRVSADATARIKGQLSDGNRFATRGTVNIVDGVPTLTFYDDPDDMRFSGTLTITDQSVGGSTHTHRKSSGEGLYPRGYDITQSVEGSYYIPPEPHRRVLDTFVSRAKFLTISFSGGPLGGSFSRDLELENNDKVKVLNAGEEDLKLKINRKSGRFEAGVTIDAVGTRLKANGVLIQAVTTITTVDFITTKSGGTGGHGVGTFKTDVGTGTVTIELSGSGGSGGSPTPTPTPTPVPLPTPTPTPTTEP